MAKHLITGGCGFLGSFIAKSLIDMGEEVYVLDVVDDPLRNPKAKYIQCDILNYDKLLSACEGMDFVHLNAALVPLKKAGDRFWEVNVQGTKNVLQACKATNIKHLAHMSSSAVFGNVTEADCPIQTDPNNLHPIEIYGESKHAAELIIKQEMQISDGLSCSIIRPRTIIGTERLGIFQILFEWISEGRNIYIIGNGKNLFQFAHVDDLVFASIQSCLQRSKSILNIGTDKFGTLRECLSNLCKAAGSKSKVVGIPTWLAIPALYILDKTKLSPLGPWHYLTYHKPYYFDLSHSKKAIGWQPKYSNDSMLIESYRWYLENKNKLNEQRSKNKSAHRGTLKQGI